MRSFRRIDVSTMSLRRHGPAGMTSICMTKTEDKWNIPDVFEPRL